MRRIRLRHCGAWVLVLAAAAVAPLVRAEPAPQAFSAALPFTEAVTFTYQAPCFALGRLNGSGASRPMGTVHATSQDCINPLGAFDPNAPSFQFASTAPGFTLTAANGDSVVGAYSGTLSYQPNAPHKMAGHFVITGGTGRYAGATGGGTLSGYEDISSMTTGRGVVLLNGKIQLAH